ncbi:deoxyribodipyrimidine photo-lyase [candidate division KSB1 bacterium]|nr:deoxyribodipyrimidine photo-lyase [candidate division KSB1 bacterium]
MIQDERIRFLNDSSVQNGKYVLYWMQASQRTLYNHALEYAVQQANDRKKPLVVFFGITEAFPEANERHYYFMLEGLKEVKDSLEERKTKMVVRLQSPEKGVKELAEDADLVITDRGYLIIQKMWRHHAGKNIDCPLIQVESDVIVPVEEAERKEAYSAGTFRPKISKKLNMYLLPISEHAPKLSSMDFDLESFEIADIDAAISNLKLERSVHKSRHFHGGLKQAQKHLDDFISNKLDKYADLRNDPTTEYLSQMSPYLHFGQISPLYIALKVLSISSPGAESYLEELIVRRELSMNFVFYNPDYANYSCLPDWAKKTLSEHRNDAREFVYSKEDWEEAKTHDPYWNAAQREMMITGKMHGYMRMYWGKKILEWSRSPEDAFEIALYLNNKYEIDGRDPNGYAGVAWCFGKHDRAWQERPVFGKTRYMNANGLRRKFDADAYVEKIEKLK